MMISKGLRWDIQHSSTDPRDMERLLADGWEPYAVVESGGRIIHYYRKPRPA